MTSNRSALVLLAALTAAASAQTTPVTPKKPATTTTTTHHTTATATKKPATTATPVADPKDAPPNVPKITGTPKPLYTLRYVDTVIGTGPLAEPRKFYTVHYTGWTTDGTKFDSSVDRGTPITFPYGAHQVIPGWDTGFQDMHVGGKRRLFIPYQLAYGEAGRPPVIPAKADLIFDIELISMSDTPPAPPTKPAEPTKPADSTKPPTDPAKPASETAKPPTDPTKPTVDPAKPADSTAPAKPQGL
ncbi:FKBP-type peptidyl-prolyl cis-trans isomerase [Granulicella sp. dw_53]|uniref:FKBP-type peptidyl-prolyl cis-trans isomerase n=1 Tax=Granulicella sp. dw_53 TaxID=2719792 RepID=UPI001BD2DDE9|nr:FKBP-type peptidyl-prolyl cis-trans isomerase [Granulicella sp. dw_53]